MAYSTHPVSLIHLQRSTTLAMLQVVLYSPKVMASGACCVNSKEITKAIK